MQNAVAAGPQLKTSTAGWYRMMLGDFEVTALSDGTVDVEVIKPRTNTPVAKVQRALARAYLKDPVETSVNGYLINTGTKLVLIDAGAGAFFGPTLGNLVADLKASGDQPEQVDEIYATHMHADHVGGLVSGEKVVFPNAILRAVQREADFWLSQKVMDAAPAEARDFFTAAMAAMNPYVDAGKFKPFVIDTAAGAAELKPASKAVPARAHTPEHAIYVVESKGQKLVAWGDLMHVAAVQFPDPSVTIQFHVDARAAMPERREAFADAAKRGYYVALSDISFPGIGRLRADGKGDDWVPANYSVLR